MDIGCFNNIIGKLCENGTLAEAEKLFEEMETKSVLPDVYSTPTLTLSTRASRKAVWKMH
jgi:pentatricopeptide repeat protein